MPHIHELYDFTVGIFIVHDDMVLLVRHPRYGKWLQPGGHIELDEDPEQAIFREVAEETGLTIKLLAPKPELNSPGTKFLPTPAYVDVHDANPPHRHINFVYFAESNSSDFILSAKHTEIKWFSSEELNQDKYGLSAAIIFYAQEALAVAKRYS